MARQSREGLVIGLLAVLGVLMLVLALRGPGGGWGGDAAGQTAKLAPASAGFTLATCQSSLMDDRPALALVFSQPVDGRQDLSKLLRVTDLGAVAAPGTRGGSSSPSPAGSTPQTDTAGRIVQGSWTVGDDNPRIVYFPYVQPQRRWRVDLDAAIRSVDGVTLAQAEPCEVASEAMPASFEFASRGVVLPAGQNGGLPIATVNVPDVDIEFLRIEPSALTRFIERVAGARMPSLQPGEAGDEEEGDEGEGYAPQGAARSMQGQLSGWQLDELKNAARSVHQARWHTDDRPDRRHVSFIDVESIRELQQPGVYVAVMRQPGRFAQDFRVTYFYVTDIGLHARRYDRGMAVFVTSLLSGEAMGEIDVALLDENGRQLAQARSDAAGLVRFDTVHDASRLLVARRGSRELSLVALNAPALDLSEFDVGGHPSRNVELFAYAGRDLYRPGERFRVSVLARGPDGHALEPLPLDAVLKRPDGRTVRQSRWPVDPKRPGYFEQAVELPADAPTGRWSLELRQDPAARQPDTRWSFQVEEFLPERMKLTLRHESLVLAPDDDFVVQVQGDYLYGAPAAGNRLISSVATERQRQALPQAWPGFVFGDSDDDARRGREEVEEQTLDEQGKATVSLPTRPGAGVRAGETFRSPMLLRASFSLLESGGRPVVRSLERAVWPAPTLLAVRPLFERDVTTEDAPAAFELIRVDAQGQMVPLPPGTQASVRLMREERRYHWRYDDQRGWHAGYVDTDELVETRSVGLAGRERLSLPVTWGRYRLEVDDPETGLSLRYRFYAGWSAQDAEAMGNRPDRVQLQVEGLPLAEGARSLRTTVVPPHDGEALVTVEGDRLLWSRRLPVKAAGTPIEIPIDPAWTRHDLYLSVTAFRPGSQGRLVTPSRAVGMVHVPLERSDRRLEVSIEAPPKVLPERRTMVRLKVDGAQGASQAYVTLSAVDVGILEITRYRTPDPIDRFFGKHRYAGEIHDLYGRLIEKMEGRAARLRFGGDSSARDTQSLPRKVQLVDLFSGAVALDAQGQASIPLDVPDFNGTLRLMAVAFTPERYGSAQTEMVSAAPIVAELAMPRFIAPGDQATIAVDVTNLSGTSQDMRITLRGTRPLTVEQGNVRLTLAHQQRRTLRFAVGAVDPEGLGKLQLQLDARLSPGATPVAGSSRAPLALRREAWLQVLPAVPLQRETRRLRIEPGAQATLEAPLLGSVHAGSATASLTLSDQPPLNLRAMVQGLLQYPYGCAEQTTSAAYPWLVLDADAEKRLGLRPHTAAERREAVDRAVGRLAGMQRPDGGFALWGNGPAGLWLSAYVQGFLQDAAEAGFSVPEAMARRGREYLLQQLLQTPNRFPEWPGSLRAAMSGAGDAASGARASLQPRDLDLLRDGHQRFAELALAGYVLAREQQAPLASLRSLHDRYRDRARSPLPLLQLAVALRLMGDAPRAEAALQDAMQRPYGVAAALPAGAWPVGGYEWLGDYGSPLRDLAQGYALMLRHGVEHTRREQWLFDAANLMGGRRYLSTQERQAVFEAGRRAGLLAPAAAEGWQARLADGTDTLLQSGSTLQRSLEVAALAAGRTQLTNSGPAALFAEVDVAGYPTSPPPARQDMIELQRRWFNAKGEPWPAGRSPRVGEMLVVELKAKARQRMDDALIVDRLPAGFEIENLSLSQGPKAEEFVVGGVSVAETLADPRVRHREFRDDRFVAAARLDRESLTLHYLVRVVSPGRFVVPAPYAEDMYRPELYGLGAAGAPVTIVDPQSAP